MSDFTIEKVFVRPFEREGSALCGLARIQIEGGLFLSELRIYGNSGNVNSLYIAFPTRKDASGGDRKVVYPITDQARMKITKAIIAKYIEETDDK